MVDLNDALAAAAQPALPAPGPPPRVLVVGGGGPLGEQVIEHLLAAARFHRVGVLVDRPLHATPRGLQGIDDSDTELQSFGARAAVIVFDRERKFFGRDAAFVRPDPRALVALASRLQRSGVRHLIVAVRHAPAMLPQALLRGLATLDENAVAGLGFEHLIFMRVAQAGGDGAAGTATSAPDRLARWMLRQLHWMVPQREQPVRSETVARVVAALLARLPETSPGTRVLPPTLLWYAAQQRDLEPLLRGWLSGQPLPALPAARQRW
jgi:hypothetical protein